MGIAINKSITKKMYLKSLTNEPKSLFHKLNSSVVRDVMVARYKNINAAQLGGRMIQAWNRYKRLYYLTYKEWMFADLIQHKNRDQKRKQIHSKARVPSLEEELNQQDLLLEHYTFGRSSGKDIDGWRSG